MEARTARTADRREAILAAALACFTEHGYERTAIEDIRKRSGASIGSIYHHFGGKDQLAGALYVESLRSYQEGLLTLLRTGSAERTVKALVRHHLRWVEKNRERALFLFETRPPGVQLASEAELRDLNRVAFSAVERWRAEHSAELQPVSFDAFYAAVIGPAQEASRHLLAGRTQTPVRRLERELADAAWRAIKGER